MPKLTTSDRGVLAGLARRRWGHDDRHSNTNEARAAIRVGPGRTRPRPKQPTPITFSSEAVKTPPSARRRADTRHLEHEHLYLTVVRTSHLANSPTVPTIWSKLSHTSPSSVCQLQPGWKGPLNRRDGCQRIWPAPAVRQDEASELRLGVRSASTGQTPSSCLGVLVGMYPPARWMAEVARRRATSSWLSMI